MMQFVQVARKLEGMSHPQRAYALTRILGQAFEHEDSHGFKMRLDYNAKLMTFLRREKIWPPC